ncbi:MAG: hypothetical protein ABSF45_04270 [Terriglobia bacterium]|jgi:hypothetical protein
MGQQAFSALFLTVILLPTAASAKKPTGKISDVAAFSKIRSYCVDSSDLPSDEAYDLKGFVSTENKPKKLLSKLPWTLVSDCSQGAPDVVVTMEFQKFAPVHDNAPAEGELFTIRAYLRVSQGTSSQVLYEVETAPSNNSLTGKTPEQANEPLAVQCHGAIYAAFWTLIEDVQRISQTIAK